jgi:hypothetical protein
MRVFKIYWQGVGVYVFGLMIVCVVMSSAASAGFIWSNTEPGGWSTSTYYNNDGDPRVTNFYDPDGNWAATAWYDTEGNLIDLKWDPNPAEDNGNYGIDEDQIDLLVELAKEMGSAGFEQEEIWQTFSELGLLPEDDMGPNVIDPYDFGTLSFDEFGYGYGGFYYDPNVPFDEQMPNSRDTEEDDEEEADSYPVESDPSSYGEYYGLSPELVNPVPALINR